MAELAALASPQVAAGDLLAVPLGATEQHGPHLPLGTDTMIATALARGLARDRDEITVAPALPYGASGEHQALAGTLSVGAEALETVLVELGRSATETFARVLLVSGHGGNAAGVRRAVRRLRDEGRDVRDWDPAATFAGDAHAGHVETSLVLALAPETVAMERAAPGNPAPLATLIGALRAGGVHAVSDNGVLGDPTRATARAGSALLEDGVRALCGFVDDWRRG